MHNEKWGKDLEDINILWTCNNILPHMSNQYMASNKYPRSVSWMEALLNAIKELPNVKLSIVTFSHEYPFSKNSFGNVCYYLVPCKRKELLYSCGKRVIEQVRKIISEVKPDIIHIHGSEYSYGSVITKLNLDIPVVLSIQGLVHICEKVYYANIPFSKLFFNRSISDWLLFRGVIESKFIWKKRGRYEIKILKTINNFIGRTIWDKAHIHYINPGCNYFECDELLRDEFYHVKWNINEIEQRTILTSSSVYPLKGFHVLLEAVRIVKQTFPDIVVKVAGSNFSYNEGFWKREKKTGYVKYILRLVKKYNLMNNIIPLGRINAAEMAENLRKSHVYVLPSFMENSPNSLAEAQIIGTPSIVSFVGGVQSMVSDGIDTLAYPAGDYKVLAEQIIKLLNDNDIAETISSNARMKAKQKYNKNKIVDSMMNIYRSLILSQNNG